MKTTLLIMAAGIGSRFGTGIKQLEPVDIFADVKTSDFEADVANGSILLSFQGTLCNRYKLGTCLRGIAKKLKQALDISRRQK